MVHHYRNKIDTSKFRKNPEYKTKCSEATKALKTEYFGIKSVHKALVELGYPIKNIRGIKFFIGLEIIDSNNHD